MTEQFLLRIDGVIETLVFDTLEARDKFIHDFHGAIIRGIGEETETPHIPIMTLYNTFKKP